MTKQEIFDKVARHLLVQNAQSMFANDSNLCTYRGGGGRMCAVGCLIPDELYHEGLEGMGVFQVQGTLEAALGPVDVTGLDMLHDLQTLHDQECPEDWPEGLREIAVSYGLSSQVVDRTLIDLLANCDV